MKHLKAYINDQIAKTYRNGVTTVDLYELIGAFKLAQNLLGDTWHEFLGEEHIVINWLSIYYHNACYDLSENRRVVRELKLLIETYLRHSGYPV